MSEIQKRFLNLQNFEIIEPKAGQYLGFSCDFTETNYVISEALDKSTTSACAEQPLNLVESEVLNVPLYPESQCFGSCSRMAETVDGDCSKSLPTISHNYRSRLRKRPGIFDSLQNVPGIVQRRDDWDNLRKISWRVANDFLRVIYFIS